MAPPTRRRNDLPRQQLESDSEFEFSEADLNNPGIGIESSGDESTPEDEEESLSTAHIGSSFLTTEQTATEANPTIPQVDTTQVASNAANSFSVLTIPLKPVIPNTPKILAALKNKTKDKINIRIR